MVSPNAAGPSRSSARSPGVLTCRNEETFPSDGPVFVSVGGRFSSGLPPRCSGFCLPPSSTSTSSTLWVPRPGGLAVTPVESVEGHRGARSASSIRQTSLPRRLCRAFWLRRPPISLLPASVGRISVTGLPSPQSTSRSVIPSCFAVVGATSPPGRRSAGVGRLVLDPRCTPESKNRVPSPGFVPSQQTSLEVVSSLVFNVAGETRDVVSPPPSFPTGRLRLCRSPLPFAVLVGVGRS
jgi:hypothetical protein